MLRDLIQSWITRKLAWRLDDFVLAAICYADDVVSVAASVAAAEVMVTEVIAKLKEVGLTVGAQKTRWTSYPKMVDKSIMVDGLAVLWEEVLEFVGSKVCVWRPVLKYSWLPRMLRLNTVKNFNVAGISLEVERLDDGQGPKRQKCELECENGGKRDWSEKPPGMEMDQWWRLWQRTGHRWIEKSNMNVFTAFRERLLSWAGHVARMDYKEICAKALRCRGLQWWRWRQFHWKEMERKTQGLAHTHNVSKSSDGRTWWLVRSPSSLGTQDGFSESVQESTGGCILPCFDGPRCLGDLCASGLTGTGAGAACVRWSRMVPPDTEYRSRPHFWMTERNSESEVWRALATPLCIEPVSVVQ